MFDFPEPFGPTTTHTPGSKSSVVLSAKDLKPFSVSDFRNTVALPPGRSVGASGSPRRTEKTAVSIPVTTIAATWPLVGDDRR